FDTIVGHFPNEEWLYLTGVEFELFLATLLVKRGFTVETTKVSGDQGVDLVATKNHFRIAIQAKGYPSSTVGNKAVQEVFTGMIFYKCDAAVVITNSTFTKSAKELADQVGCILIEKTQIYDLMSGRLNLENWAKQSQQSVK
ncbi:MAG TPA: restriction endonuclease, partial [Isosphaeraceae bacterium]|nr:restriction endonuclease [Isosphaeraceae bacterium]